MLVASWLRRADAAAVAWVTVERDERDATRFWGLVMDALRRCGAIAQGDGLATLTPAPLGGQGEFVQRLAGGLRRLAQPVVLVLDDLHELRSDEALHGLAEVVADDRAPLRTVLLSRREPRLGLHRLRLAGALAEIRAQDLDFTPAEAAGLLAAAAPGLAAADAARLHERTEGWAAALRLAALSLTRHHDPARFVAEFAGSERTVAEYLLGEVLASQPAEVRRLLLRTCIVDRVNGALADHLTGRDDGARLLHELEEAHALVVAVDVGRTWFRYHHLLADLLRVELARESPAEIAALHRRAACWFAEHGPPVEAIRHAALGDDFDLAVELLGRHWVGLVLDGEEATLGALLARVPARVADAELDVVRAADLLARTRWTEADALLAAAEEAMPSVPAARRARAETALATVHLLRARVLGVPGDLLERASGVLDAAAAPGASDLQALGLMNLGIADGWALRLRESEEHLDRGLALARRLGRAFVEIGCLGGLGTVCVLTGRTGRAEEHLRSAIAVADRLGWSAHPVVGAAYATLATIVVDRGDLGETQELLARADPILTRAPEPAACVALRHAQGMLALAHGRHDEALDRFVVAEQVAAELRSPHFLGAVAAQWQLRVRLLLGQRERVRAAVEAAGGAATAQWRNLAARLHLDDDEPHRAATAVAPVVAGEAFAFHVNVEIEALLLDALARDRQGERAAAERSVERALALAEPAGRVWMVTTLPGAHGLLDRHPVHRTAHAALLGAWLDHLAGSAPSREGAPQELPELLTERELAVLRFLPTNLSATEIGSELFLSVHTVKTHMRKLYAKLDVHTRAEAVQRARSLGLLAPARR